MMDRKRVALCFVVRDNAYYLPGVFKNIDDLNKLDFDFVSIFITDNITDNSIELIQEYKSLHPNVIHRNIQNHISYRTHRIANARNSCLDIIYNELDNIDYHIMIDADDVNHKKWDIEVINNYLNNWDNDDWHSITFNRPSNYYDLWALLYDDYYHHCWGYGGENMKYIHYIQKEFKEKLDTLKENSVEVHSSFCGFGIYKTELHRGIRYEGMFKNVKHLLKPEESLIFARKETEFNLYLYNNLEICEHIYYNLMAKERGLKHKVSKYFVSPLG